jgi:hypothetical protein
MTDKMGPHSRLGAAAWTSSGMPCGLRRIACDFEGRARRVIRAMGSARPLSVARWIASRTRMSARPSSPEGSGSRPCRTLREKATSSAAI